MFDFQRRIYDSSDTGQDLRVPSVARSVQARDYSNTGQREANSTLVRNASPPRVMPSVQFFQSFARHVRVYLGSRKIAMSQQ